MSPEDGADLARAQHLFDLHRPAEALTAVSATLATRPDDPGALRLAARCQSALGRDEEALRTARSAVAAEPSSEYGHRILAEILRRKKNFREASAAAAEAVRLAPEAWPGHLVLAQCLFRLDARAALESAQRACQLAPLSADTHYIRGVVLRALGRKQEARDAYLRALTLDPQHPQSHNALALLDQSRWPWGGSLQGFRRSLSLDPQQRTARRNLESVILRRLWRLGWLAVIAMQIVNGAAKGDGGSRALAVVVDLGLVAAAWSSLWPARRDLGMFGRQLIRTDRRALICEAVVVAAVLLIAASAIAPSITGSGVFLAVWWTAEAMVVLVLIQLRAMARQAARHPEAL